MALPAQEPATAASVVRYSTRKRPRVSYVEADLDNYVRHDDELSVVESDEGVEEEYFPRKKRKGARRSISVKSKRTMWTKKEEKKTKPFPFLSLPAELRNVIYTQALIDPKGVFLVSKTKAFRRIVCRANPDDSPSRAYRSRRRYRHYHLTGGQISESQRADEASPPTVVPLVPALLATCRQIRDEAQGLFYKQRITVEDTTALHTFLASIGPGNRGLLDDLTVKGWGWSKAHKALNHPAMSMLAAGVLNLSRLYFDCEVGWRWTRTLDAHLKGLARQIYRDGFHWFEAVGAAKGSKGAAVEIIEFAERNLARSHYRSEQQHDEAEQEKAMTVVRAELRRLLGCQSEGRT